MPEFNLVSQRRFNVVSTVPCESAITQALICGVLFLEANHAGKQMYTTQLVTCFRIQTNHAALHVEQIKVIEENLIYPPTSNNAAEYQRYQRVR